MKNVTQLWPLETGAAGSGEQLGFLHSTGTDRLQPELPWANPTWLLLVPHMKFPYLAVHPTKLEPKEHHCSVHWFPEAMRLSLRIGFPREWVFQGGRQTLLEWLAGVVFLSPKICLIMGPPGGKSPMHLEEVVKKETSGVFRCHHLPTVRKK